MRVLRSLRVRLTLTFALGVGLVVLLVGVATAVLVGRAIWGPLDAELGEEAETLCTLRASAEQSLQTAAEAIARESTPGPGKFVLVLDGAGNILARAGTMPPEDPSGISGPTTSPAGPGGSVHRVVPFADPSGTCRAFVGSDARRWVWSVRRARAVIATIGVAVLVVLSALGWFTARRATAELTRLAGEIETIEAVALHRRLDSRHTLEIDRLAEVLNRLLARLDDAIGHLRRFTADAAHELRTPIAALRARLEVTIAGERSPKAYQDGLVDALEQTEGLGRLAEDLLTLSTVEARDTAERFEDVRLDQVAGEVVESLAPIAQEQGREFTCDAAEPAVVWGDPALLKRVALNLIDNAFRHTPPAAPVTVSVRSLDGAVVLEVRDGGPGLPEDAVPRVLDPFHRLRRNTGGSGLGLTICREIVALHRGTIELVSAPGEGSVVRITVPSAARRG